MGIDPPLLPVIEQICLCVGAFGCFLYGTHSFALICLEPFNLLVGSAPPLGWCCRNRSGQRWTLFSPNRCPHNLDEVVMLDLHTPTKLREAVPSQVLRSADAVDVIEKWLKIVQRHLCEHLLPCIQSHLCSMHTSTSLQLPRLCSTACCFSCNLHLLLSVLQIVCYSHAILYERDAVVMTPSTCKSACCESCLDMLC